MKNLWQKKPHLNLPKVNKGGGNKNNNNNNNCVPNSHSQRAQRYTKGGSLDSRLNPALVTADSRINPAFPAAFLISTSSNGGTSENFNGGTNLSWLDSNSSTDEKNNTSGWYYKVTSIHVMKSIFKYFKFLNLIS